MFSKSLFVFALAALAQLQLVVATPPACLLGAVNQYDDASDIEAVCKSKDATSKIAKLCGGSTKDALAAFADICNEKGVKVSTNIASATGTASGTAGTISPTATANGTMTGGSGSGTGGAIPTGPTATGSGAAQATGAASTLDISAAALLAGLGFVAAAL